MARRQRTHKRQQRGAGAAEHAIAVYGPAGQQHAVAGTNVIAVNPVMRGGDNNNEPTTEPSAEPSADLIAKPTADTSNQQTNQSTTVDPNAKGGKVDLTSLAVPAVLIAANHMYGRRGKTSRKTRRGKTSRKTRRGRRSNRRFSRRR